MRKQTYRMVAPTHTRAKQSRFRKKGKGCFQITKIHVRSHGFELYFPAQIPREKEVYSLRTAWGLEGREVKMTALKFSCPLQAKSQPRAGH